MADRDVDYEDASGVYVVGDANGAVVEPYVFAHHAQPYAASHMGMRFPVVVYLVEAFEDMLLVFVLDSDSGVGHLDAEHGAFAPHLLQRHIDPASRRSELYGVAEKVHEDLLKLVVVEEHMYRIVVGEEGERDVLAFGKT